VHQSIERTDEAIVALVERANYITARRIRQQPTAATTG